MKRYKEMTNSIEEELERIEELAMTDEGVAYDNLVELRDKVRDLREEVNCSATGTVLSSVNMRLLTVVSIKLTKE